MQKSSAFLLSFVRKQEGVQEVATQYAWLRKIKWNAYLSYLNAKIRDERRSMSSS